MKKLTAVATQKRTKSWTLETAAETVLEKRDSRKSLREKGASRKERESQQVPARSSYIGVLHTILYAHLGRLLSTFHCAR